MLEVIRKLVHADLEVLIYSLPAVLLARRTLDNSGTFISAHMIIKRIFSDVEYAAKKKLTRRDRFLAESKA